MKKIISILVVSVLSLTILTGCDVFDNPIYWGIVDFLIDNDIVEKGESTDPAIIAQKKSEKLFEYFQDGDVEAIKGLFCEKIASSHDLDKEIADALAFIDGNIISHGDLVGHASGNDSIRDGVVVICRIAPTIDDIKTDTGHVYKIAYSEYLVYEEDKSFVGITRINVIDENYNKIIIGEVVNK